MNKNHILSDLEYSTTSDPRPYGIVTKTQESTTQESQEVSPFTASDHKAARNRLETNLNHMSFENVR